MVIERDNEGIQIKYAANCSLPLLRKTSVAASIKKEFENGDHFSSVKLSG